jgi:exonuclease III
LRILAWNVNHRARPKRIAKGIVSGILSFSPDVVVLTEYVEGPDHSALCSDLEAGGLAALFLTPIQGTHNQVLVASRSMSTLGTFVPPDSLPHAVSNCLHVRLTYPSLDLLGLRVPMYKSLTEKRSYWDWFETAIQPLFAYPAVIIGDLNADPRRSIGPGTDHLRRLEAAGWQLPDPAGPWSYISHQGKTSRLDHALVSPSVTVGKAEYFASVHGYVFAGPVPAHLSGCAPLVFSDHAPLVLDITVLSGARDAF